MLPDFDVYVLILQIMISSKTVLGLQGRVTFCNDASIIAFSILN